MQIQVETRYVAYRLRGARTRRLRAFISLDGVPSGKILGEPDAIRVFLSIIKAGAVASQHTYWEFHAERKDKLGQVLEHNPDAKCDPSGAGLSPSNKRTNPILP